jgi:hypothetical protein
MHSLRLGIMVRLLSVLEGTGAGELGTFVDWLSTNADSGGDAGWDRSESTFFSRPRGDAPYQIIPYTIISVFI